MKNKRLIYSALLSGILVAATGCSENEQSVPLDENELIELQVSPKVTLTRSAINGGEQTGNGANVMQNIAVYAQSTITNTDAKKNNYAIYTQSSGNGATPELIKYICLPKMLPCMRIILLINRDRMVNMPQVRR